MEMQQILFEHRKNKFYCEGGQTWKQAAQRGCGICVFGDIQNLAGHSPEQPAPAAPDLSEGVGIDNLQRPLPTSPVL